MTLKNLTRTIRLSNAQVLPTALIGIWIAGSPLARADSLVLDAASRDSGVKFSIPYKLGTHDGTVAGATGSLTYDRATDTVTAGTLTLAIAGFDTGNVKRNCHLQESLGLDYALSVYPESHVCAAENKLPATGNDAVKFPEVRFAVTSGKRTAATTLHLIGTLSLHGVSRPLELDVETKAGTNGAIEMIGAASIRLKDFAIEVKPFLFVDVGDVATVTFDVSWVPSP